MRNSEKQFFESIYTAGSTDWEVELSPNRQPGDPANEPLDVFLYLVDTSCDWMAVGCMTTSAFLQASEATKDFDLVGHTLGSAAAAMMAVAAQDYDADSSHAPLALRLSLVVAALQTTATFSFASKNGVAGHWLYIAYRARSGKVLCRPAFYNDGQLGLMGKDKLQGLVRHVVQRDSSPQSGSSILTGAGPVELHPTYQS